MADACALSDVTTAISINIGAYAAACLAAGVSIGNWRNETGAGN